jgi:hypothetical protein
MRQTGDPDFTAAVYARAIIEFHRSWEEKRRRLQSTLDARRASGEDPWPILDELQMLDTLDQMGLRDEKRITHKEAMRIAIELLGDGISKPAVTIEIDAAGRRMVCGKPQPGAPRRRPDPDKALDLLRRDRTR